jgi:Fuc2NAc and GlcNAc transferase
MNAAILLASVAVCGWLSWYSTGQFVLFALRRRLLDIPNSRSSHAYATPRGGGIAFVAVFLFAIVSLGITGYLRPLELAALVGGIVMAAIGFADDCKGMGVGIRFGVQILSSFFCILCLGMEWFQSGYGNVFAMTAVMLIAVLASTWTINLVNFMDGIDGLAATETITVAGVCFALIAARHGITGPSLLFGLLAVSVAGFLLWNWNPAHVFMGDVGSCFLGYSFVALALFAAERSELSLLTPFFLLGVFIIDATMTLVRRMARGEEWYRPHRMHGFQHAAKEFGHRRTTLTVAGINLFWLAPWAVLAELRPSARWVCLAVAWLPVVGLANLLHAGQPLPADREPKWRGLLPIKHKQDREAHGFRTSVLLEWTKSSTTFAKALLLAIASGAGFCLAVMARLEAAGWRELQMESRLIVLWTATQVIVWLAFGLHRRQWHLVSIEEIPDLVGITLAGVLVSAVLGAVLMPAHFLAMSRSIFLLDAMFCAVILVGGHVLIATLYGAADVRSQTSRPIRVLVYGANNAGVSIVSALRRLCPDYFAVGLVDARRSFKGSQVSGLRVLGQTSEIADLVRLYNIDQVLISSQSTASVVGRRFVASCNDEGIDCRVITSIRDTIGNTVNTVFDSEATAVVQSIPTTLTTLAVTLHPQSVSGDLQPAKVNN